MKRSSPLKRRTELKRRAPRYDRNEPGRAEWKSSTAGYCSCGCSRFSLSLEGHHVLPLAMIRQEGRDDLAWDQRNRMPLAEFCHGRHTSGMHRLPLAAVPESAFAFAVDLLGEDRSALFFARFYASAVAA